MPVRLSRVYFRREGSSLSVYLAVIPDVQVKLSKLVGSICQDRSSRFFPISVSKSCAVIISSQPKIMARLGILVRIVHKVFQLDVFGIFPLEPLAVCQNRGHCFLGDILGSVIVIQGIPARFV